MRMQDEQSGSVPTDLRALILTADEFEDMELLRPLHLRLLDEGIRVDIAPAVVRRIAPLAGGHLGVHRRDDADDPAGLSVLPIRPG